MIQLDKLEIIPGRISYSPDNETGHPPGCGLSTGPPVLPAPSQHSYAVIEAEQIQGIFDLYLLMILLSFIYHPSYCNKLKQE